MRRAPGFMAVAAFALVIAVQPAWAQQRQIADPPVFGHTLFFGSGLIEAHRSLFGGKKLIAQGLAAVCNEKIVGA